VRRATASTNSDAILSSLTVNQGTLSPSFSSGTADYIVNVGSAVRSITLTATASLSGATVSGVGTKSLSSGSTKLNITVISPDGTKTKIYTVTVRRAAASASADARLSNLTVSQGALSPVFDSRTTDYTVIVSSTVSSITLTATAYHAGATVSGDGTKSLNSGSNRFDIIVAAQNGIATTTYTVIVHRANAPTSSDATLSSLTVSHGTLSPSFNSGTENYTVNVGYEISNITLTATASHSSAIVSDAGTKPLNPGNNTFAITVTDPEGTTTKTYTVTMNRANASTSTDATLRSLTVSHGTLSPAFNSGTENYTVYVSSAVSSIILTAIVNKSGATVSGAGIKSLNLGSNRFDIIVTAPDGVTTKTYTVTMNRANASTSTDATLSSLTVDQGTLSPSFSPGTANYTVNVSSTVSRITLTATANQSGATVTGTGMKTFSFGSHRFDITVTAPDGVTTKTYTVTVNRASPDNPSGLRINSVYVSAGIMYPSFDPDEISDRYDVYVPYEITEITITCTTNQSGATVYGDGTQPLDLRENRLYIEVVSADGITLIPFWLIVYRDENPSEDPEDPWNPEDPEDPWNPEDPGNPDEREATLRDLTINGKVVSVPYEYSSELNYTADCDETFVQISDINVSSYSSVTINGTPYYPDVPVEITEEDITNVDIRVTAESGNIYDYTLKIAAPVKNNDMYYQRWDNVLAIDHNSYYNGGIDVWDVRWFSEDGSSLGDGKYIRIQGAPENYYAEIQTSLDQWRRVCRTRNSRTIEKVVAYPNPVSRVESLTLQLPETFTGGEASIYGIGGTLVKSKIPVPAKSNSVDVSGLDTGIYLLRITGKDGTSEVIKIIIE
jgi:hypothetical protein